MSAETGEWLHAAFGSYEDARRAIRRLEDDGVPAEDVEVRTSAPIDRELLPTLANPVSRVFRMAALGGFLGGTAFFLLVKLTSEAYPLRTAAVPVVALPPAGIVTFEGVAIGAILSTVATVLYECGLPGRRRTGPLDHHLADDHVLVAVRCPEGASTEWSSGAIETVRG